MQHSKKTAIVSGAVTALMALTGTSAMAMRGGGGGGDGDGDGDGRRRVDICHVDGQGRFHKITVDRHAVPAHLRHGDTFPDEDGDCPGDTGGGGGGGGDHDHDHGRRSDCSASQDNSSDNTTGDTAQGGLLNIGGIALQGNNISALTNVLCFGDVANGLVASVLGFASGGSGDSDSSGRGSCTVDQDNSSDNQTGHTLMAGLINLGGIGLQGNNISVLDNALCGSNILNDLTAGILGSALGRF